MAVWNVELHSHTVWSKDCLMSLEWLIGICRKRGIDKIAITDHNTAEGALQMQKLAPDLVIVGEEIMTTQGELLGYFLKESIPAGLTPQETIRRLREQGAIISVSHPYDRFRKGAWAERDLLQIVGQVDALEVFNARCLVSADNDQAKAMAAACELPGTVGSDAHSWYEYGRSTLHMQTFTTAAEFLTALKTAKPQTRYSPSWVHGFSSAAKFIKKRGWRKKFWEGG